MTDEQLKVIEIEVARLYLQDGDYLVVRLDDTKITNESANRIGLKLNSLFRGKGITPLIMSKDIDLAIITKAQVEEALARK